MQPKLYKVNVLLFSRRITLAYSCRVYTLNKKKCYSMYVWYILSSEPNIAIILIFYYNFVAIVYGT